MLCTVLNSLQPNSNGLPPNFDGLQPRTNGLQPKSDRLQPNYVLLFHIVFVFSAIGFPGVTRFSLFRMLSWYAVLCIYLQRLRVGGGVRGDGDGRGWDNEVSVDTYVFFTFLVATLLIVKERRWTCMYTGE